MQDLRKIALRLRYTFPHRIVAVTLLLLVMTYTIFITTSITNAVRIVDGSSSTVTYTTKTDAQEILESQGITTTIYDHVSFSPAEDGNYAELTISRAFPVTLTADGTIRRIMVTGGTVDDVLLDNGLVLGSEDLLNLSLGQVLEENDRIVLQRVERYLVEEQETIPFEVATKSTSLLSNGSTRTLQSGSDGAKVLTFSEMTIDGVVQERTLLAEDIMRQPTEQVVLVGDGSACSELNYSYSHPLDGNGIPTNYKAVYRNQVATGYSASSRSVGAGFYSSARNSEDVGRCVPGTVAVRASQFPYGTKLYIRSSDGGFVYGYAVSNDTGSGLMQNVIDVDLFYDTYLESALTGRRSVDIYVLE